MPTIGRAELRLESGLPVAGLVVRGARPAECGWLIAERAAGARLLESTMARVMEITTPLGADVLLFHALHAREELSRVGGVPSRAVEPEGRHQPRRHSRQERHREGGAAWTTAALLQRLRDAVLAGRHARHATGATTRRCIPWIWFMTRTADCRIFQEMTVPEIVKQVFSEHPTAIVQGRAHGLVPQVDVLRAVPRDRPELRLPAVGARGHLLLLHCTTTGSTRW